MIWISQDNYGHWRYTRRNPDGGVSVGSPAFANRDDARAHAEHLFPQDDIKWDGLTQGVNMEQNVPLPQVNQKQESIAGGYELP